MSPPIWIVEGKLSFQDLIGKESAYVSAWSTIVDHWVFEPARRLAENPKVIDRGMSLLTLELAFFEPFGSILTGKTSNRASQATFSTGLKRFAEWLTENGLIGKVEADVASVIGTENAPNLVYSFARCGLMHSGTMNGGRIFVDALGVGKHSISEFNYSLPSRGKDGSTFSSEKIILLDPWRILPQLQSFVKYFCKTLSEAKKTDQLYINFKQTFERSFVQPGEIYLGLQPTQLK